MNLYQLINDVKKEHKSNQKINKKINKKMPDAKGMRPISFKHIRAFEIAHSNIHTPLTNYGLLEELLKINKNVKMEIVDYLDDYGKKSASLNLTVDGKECILIKTDIVYGDKTSFDNTDWIVTYLNAQRTRRGLVYRNLDNTEVFVMPKIVEKAIVNYAKTWEINPDNPRQEYQHKEEKNDRLL